MAGCPWSCVTCASLIPCYDVWRKKKRSQLISTVLTLPARKAIGAHAQTFTLSDESRSPMEWFPWALVPSQVWAHWDLWCSLRSGLDGWLPPLQLGSGCLGTWSDVEAPQSVSCPNRGLVNDTPAQGSGCGKTSTWSYPQLIWCSGFNSGPPKDTLTS